MNPYKIIDLQILETNSTEPVSLQQAKKWLKVTFTDDDDIIEDIIKSARQTIEEFCTLSIVTKEITVVVDLDFANKRSCIEFELPYGPVFGDMENDTYISSVKLFNGSTYDLRTAGTDYMFDGLTFKKFRTNVPGRYKIAYDTGYAIYPEAIKEAILREVAYRYENRGDDDKEMTICLSAMQKAKPFKRMAWQ